MTTDERKQHLDKIAALERSLAAAEARAGEAAKTEREACADVATQFAAHEASKVSDLPPGLMSPAAHLSASAAGWAQSIAAAILARSAHPAPEPELSHPEHHGSGCVNPLACKECDENHGALCDYRSAHLVPVATLAALRAELARVLAERDEARESSTHGMKLLSGRLAASEAREVVMRTKARALIDELDKWVHASGMRGHWGAPAVLHASDALSAALAASPLGAEQATGHSDQVPSEERTFAHHEGT